MKPHREKYVHFIEHNTEHEAGVRGQVARKLGGERMMHPTFRKGVGGRGRIRINVQMKTVSFQFLLNWVCVEGIWPGY